MRFKLLILLILLSIKSFSQSFTEKKLIGKWEVNKVEVTQIFCTPNVKYNLKDSISKYYTKASFNFLKNGKMIITSHKNIENPLHDFQKLNWKLEKNEWLLFKENTTLWLGIRKVNNKYFFDFFNFEKLPNYKIINGFLNTENWKIEME